MAVSIPCAKLVLPQFPKEVLNAIKSIASSAKTGLQTLKATKQELILSMDIALAPLQAKKSALDALLSQAREATKIIPAEMVVQCPQLGAINTVFESALVGQLEGAANIVFDVNRLTSIKTDLNAQLSQIDDGIEFLDAVVESIDEVLSTT